jgi:hypothetical protein
MRRIRVNGKPVREELWTVMAYTCLADADVLAKRLR